MTVSFALRMIYDHVMREGVPPTMRELATMLGCSSSTAHTIVHGLIDRGYVEQAGTTKTITLTEKALVLLDKPIR